MLKEVQTLCHNLYGFVHIVYEIEKYRQCLVVGQSAPGVIHCLQCFLRGLQRCCLIEKVPLN